MMEVMSHSFLQSMQKHVHKYQALLCKHVSNNSQYFDGVALQDLRCAHLFPLLLHVVLHNANAS